MDTIECSLNKGTLYYNNMKEANSYNFKVFDIVNDLQDFKNFNCIITSKTNSGKSILLKNLCYDIRKWYTKVYVFSMTSYLQPDLFDYIDKENIVTGFDEERLEKIYNEQESLVMKLKQTKIKKDDIPRILILYDDLISDPKVRNSSILQKMFVCCRHSHISQIFLTQSFTAIPPVLRKNVALAIAFYLDNYTDREAFAKSYLSTKNVKLGIMIFDKITKEPYQAICILNCLVTSNPEDYITSYISNLNVPKFKMGKSVILKHSIISLPSAQYSDSTVEWLPKIGNKETVKK